MIYYRSAYHDDGQSPSVEYYSCLEVVEWKAASDGSQ